MCTRASSRMARSLRPSYAKKLAHRDILSSSLKCTFSVSPDTEISSCCLVIAAKKATTSWYTNIYATTPSSGIYSTKRQAY
uniref:Uncharacterized protein n=1 Tax=Arundo donax TaxID=35708 RepID=A0A0A9H0V8_ARUDO